VTRKQKIASSQLSYMMAMIDNLKQGEPPKSFLHNKLSALEDKAGSILDHYRIEKFHKTDLDKASALFDILDAKIQELY
jgi:hypothetical protein